MGRTTPVKFDAQVHEWMKTVRQPELGVPYVELVYQPMLELFDFLKAHQFRVFVCSGGGRHFMRAFAEEAWGIFKEDVIGSAAAYTYSDGKIVRSDRLLGGLDLGPGKPEHIFAQTGRLPAFAGGNADVDMDRSSRPFATGFHDSRSGTASDREPPDASSSSDPARRAASGGPYPRAAHRRGCRSQRLATPPRAPCTMRPGRRAWGGTNDVHLRSREVTAGPTTPRAPGLGCELHGKRRHPAHGCEEDEASQGEDHALCGLAVQLDA